MEKNIQINLESISKNAKEIFHRLRWKGHIYCPQCGSIRIATDKQSHRCKDCDFRFSDTSNTVFHSTKLPLSKWLYAIYLFCTQSRGISSYNLSRLISVSQPTAWRMLHLIRTSIVHDLKLDGTVILDEVYLGADWGKKPSYQKFKKAKEFGFDIPPKPQDHLTNKKYRKDIKSMMMKSASYDKTQVLGISSYNNRSLILVPLNNHTPSSAIITQLNHQLRGHLPSIFQQYLPNAQHIVTDEAPIYKFFDGRHSVNNHGKSEYKSEDGFTTNRIEGVFSHLKRMIRGVYQHFSKSYITQYLNEFAWRWTHFDDKLENKIESLFGFLV